MPEPPCFDRALSLTNATSSDENSNRGGRDTKIQANAQLKLGKRGYQSIEIGQRKRGDNIEASALGPRQDF